MKTRLLNVNQVLLDKETYPRTSPDFVTLSRYASAMERGDQFPPICVGFFDGKYYLIDGRHRLEATKWTKGQHISAEVLVVKDKKEIYFEAIKRNITHGKQFSVQDVTNIIITLEDWNLSKEQISEIVRMPADRIQPFVAKRAVLVTDDSTGLQKRTALRRPITHLAGSSQKDGFVSSQNKLIGSEQIHLIDSVIRMLKNNWFDTDDDDVSKRLVTLAKLIVKSVPVAPVK